MANASLFHPARVALYARVSTCNGQQDPAMQLRELREYAQRRGFKVFAEYIDHTSGAKERRPELDRLMAACRKRKVDAVLVYRYDRFARSLRQLVNALEEFRALGIDFLSLHEGVDTSTPNGRLVSGIFASIAEFERELIPTTQRKRSFSFVWLCSAPRAAQRNSKQIDFGSRKRPRCALGKISAAQQWKRRWRLPGRSTRLLPVF
jgi:predicted site-specific integrase-resolvase